ncbi:MAG: topoisomerase C-terminal repeat-containing protein [Planctomycetota bacterium]
MERHFPSLVDERFTARMEEELDAIARATAKRSQYLQEFYEGNGVPRPAAAGGELDRNGRSAHDLHDPARQGRRRHRYWRCAWGVTGPSCRVARILRRSPTTCPDEVTLPFALAQLEAKKRGADPIGTDPETEQPVYVKNGRFGPYVQLGDGEGKEKPKMVSLLKGMTPESVDLAVALELLSLPRTVGQDDNGEDIVAYNGRYGPYIKRGADTRSLGPDDNLLTMDLARALELLAEEKRGRGARQPAAPLKVFENVAEIDGGTIRLMEGRYGPYVSDGDVNASLPKGAKVEELTVTQAIELLDARRAAGGGKKRKKAAKKATAKKETKKASTKKAAKKAAKKAPAKKAASKKAASKKATKKASSKNAASKKGSSEANDGDADE